MNETHTLTQVEELMIDLSNRIKTAETKTEKKELLKKLKNLERHWNDCSEKHSNGKKYPKKVIPKDTPKEELYKLIDSISVYQYDGEDSESNKVDEYGIDISGVSVGENRFKFKELG
jgi:hypothetical protein